MNSNDVIAVEERYLAPGISQEAQLAETAFVRGEGTLLFDVDGRQYLDFGAGIFTQNVGHNHPRVVDKTKKQMDALWNVHDGSTPARAELCLTLQRHLPEKLKRYAFFTTGAEAVEAAIRAVLGSVSPQRKRLAALRYGFHGKTQGARSLVHWDVGHSNFSGNSILGYAANCYRCPLGRTYPSCEMQCAELVNKHISTRDNVAALFFEPVQGAAGVIVPPLEYWEIISNACKENGVLLVADEVITAGGRTGKFLCSEYYGIEPDLVAAAKGLSSGFPFSVLFGTEEMMSQGGLSQAGTLSSTYGGNPLSCAAATATLEVIEDEKLIEGVTSKGDRLGSGLQALMADHPMVGDVRGLGLLWALEFVSCRKRKTPDPDAAQAFYQRVLQAGVRVCFGGNIVRIGPPLNSSESEIEEALSIFDQVLGQLG